MDDLVKRADEVLKDVTPGPWEAVFDRQTWGWLEVDGPSFNVSAPTRATDLSLADAVQRKKDARFIAAARELVPAMRDRIEADAKRIERGVNAELLDQQQAMRERIAELEAERDEALRRRDAWKARAENHVEIVNALRAKTAGKDSRTLSRALLGAAFAEAESRAEAAEARVKELEAANARLRGVLSGHQIWDSAEKVSADEFVLWAPDGHVAIRLKVTHRHDQLSEAGLEFLTCDLLDLLNARAALEGEKP